MVTGYWVTTDLGFGEDVGGSRFLIRFSSYELSISGCHNVPFGTNMYQVVNATRNISS